MVRHGQTTSLFLYADEPQCDRMTQRALNMMESSVRMDATIDQKQVGNGELDEAGRYVIEQTLGRGAFGRVFRAQDTMLRVQVAVKVIDRAGVSLERVLAEARAAAKLNHPNIVPVRDTGVTSVGQAYIVLELVQGCSLWELSQGSSLAITRAVELVLAVTRAVGAAHVAGIVHRDLKPGNILIDGAGKPLVTDFGLAYDVDYDRGAPEVAGTPGYMAPEQLRAEIHRIDSRTDLWAIGAILFEMLTGQRAVSSELQRRQARSQAPLNGLDLPVSERDLPPELVAICHRCLAFSQADRYQSAFELADDLQYWFDSSKNRTAASQQVQIVPKGLQSFDETDREFFLRLLPGPRDRFGLPESIRFWKQRIETRDPSTMLTVGVCYGSSGCGKSSLIRAGLLPQLTENVAVTWVAATPQQTEMHLLERLRRGHTQVPAGLGLVDTVAWIRARNARHPLAKTLIVIDQFEQWLTPSRASTSGEFVNALRHCDGHVACLLIVRDEYWLSLTRFMKLLEVPLQQRLNVAMVDLFESDHAVRVLEEFGTAWDKWLDKSDSGRVSKASFLETAVEQLASDGRVPCIHLVFLAEALRQSDWTVETLRLFGGAKGCMQRHLDLLLSRGPSTMRVQDLESLIRQILTALIPTTSETIKGEPKSREHLIQLCEPAWSRNVAEVILDWMVQDLRLISRQEDDLSIPDSPDASSHCYQLTHDFLVELVRNWLQRRRQRTLRGMAQVLLEERTRSWQDKPTVRSLPGLFEWLMISALVPRRERSASARRMLLKADRYYRVRSVGAVGAFLLVFGLGVLLIRDRRAKAEAERIFPAEVDQVPVILAAYSGSRSALASYLTPALSDPDLPHRMELKIRLALVGSDSAQIAALIKLVPAASPEEIQAMSQVLRSIPQSDRMRSAMVELWSAVQNSQLASRERLRAAVLVANSSAEPAAWAELAPAIIEWVVAEPQHLTAHWIRLFSPFESALTTELQSIVQNVNTGRSREVAIDILTQHKTENSQEIVDVAPWLQPEELAGALRPSDQRKAATRAQLQKMTVLRQDAYRNLSETKSFEEEDGLDQAARRISSLILARARLGDWSDYLENLKFSENPRLRTFLIHSTFKAKLDRDRLWQELLTRATDAKSDAGRCQGLLLAFGDPVKREGEYKLTPEQVYGLKLIFTNHPDAGVHSAAEWLLRIAIGDEDLAQLKLSWISHSPIGNRNWYIIAEGLTFAVVKPDAYTMGVPDWFPVMGSFKNAPHVREISRRFAISTTEVTGKQYSRLKGLNPGSLALSSPQHPIVSVSRNDAMTYCQLLTRREQLDASADCYEFATDSPGSVLVPKATSQECQGYRLPTEAEVEYVFRAGTTTLKHYGYAPELLNLYEWHFENSNNSLHPVAQLRPNSWGLFDSLGNAAEMCSDPGLHLVAEFGKLENGVPKVNPEGARMYGGMYMLPQKYFFAGYRRSAMASGGTDFTFRVARTLPD